jgi:hypothetical protein
MDTRNTRAQVITYSVHVFLTTLAALANRRYLARTDSTGRADCGAPPDHHRSTRSIASSSGRKNLTEWCKKEGLLERGAESAD